MLLGIPWLAAFQEALPKDGWDALFSDLYTVGTESFITEIAAYKKFGAEIMFLRSQPAGLRHLLNQCLQQGFKPKLAPLRPSPSRSLRMPAPWVIWPRTSAVNWAGIQNHLSL